jgi:hypothetical protein
MIFGGFGEKIKYHVLWELGAFFFTIWLKIGVFITKRLSFVNFLFYKGDFKLFLDWTY